VRRQRHGQPHQVCPLSICTSGLLKHRWCFLRLTYAHAASVCSRISLANRRRSLLDRRLLPSRRPRAARKRWAYKKLLGINLAIGGRRIQESTGTADMKKAQEYHDRAVAELWKQSKLGAKPRYTWNETVVPHARQRVRKGLVFPLRATCAKRLFAVRVAWSTIPPECRARCAAAGSWRA